jgi:hypothetical protein
MKYYRNYCVQSQVITRGRRRDGPGGAQGLIRCFATFLNSAISELIKQAKPIHYLRIGRYVNFISKLKLITFCSPARCINGPKFLFFVQQWHEVFLVIITCCLFFSFRFGTDDCGGNCYVLGLASNRTKTNKQTNKQTNKRLSFRYCIRS